jgi:cyanophycinase
MGKSMNGQHSVRQKKPRSNGVRSNGTNGVRPVAHRGKGTLLIIGGHEDKTGDKIILREFVRLARSGTLVVATLASKNAGAELWENYRRVFTEFGVKQSMHLDVESREDARDTTRMDMIEQADAIFFTGGDQLQLTSQLGGTPLCEHIQAFYYERGGLIAGTSAGASVMCETMLVSGKGDESHKVGDTLRMAPGLGFVKDMIIDQHFAERGRIGRLLAAVAQNPRILGVGIDEDTAILVEGEECFQVLGSGAVYVVDGRNVTETNISQTNSDRTLSIFDVQLHLLSQGDTFDLRARQPTHHSVETETAHECPGAAP